MNLPAHMSWHKRLASWRRIVVCLAILVFVVTLATRTFHASVADQPNVQSLAGKAVRQYLDTDALEWSPPVAAFVLFLLPVAAPHAPPDVVAIRTVDLEDCLYNRPPPTFC